ncbi:MAG: LysR family transcriptional regulator [Acidobacteria bacterium]|nr:LysR family transcriptional regulator [Acidobacteriota bacterium]
MDLIAPLPVSLRQLQYVVAVADLGGFRKAADACHVSQPSLSAQIARVEEALGVRVFERNRRQVRVSAAGQPLVSQARAVLVAAGDLTELGRQLADPFTGTLRIGVIPTISPYLLPEIAPGLVRVYPRLTIVWREDHTRGLVRQVNDGTLDAAVLALEADLGTLEHTTLMRDPFLLAAAPEHPLAAPKRRARIQDLDDEGVLLLDDGHCFRDQALQLCARVGAREAGYRATSLATLVQMASAQRGVTLLPSIALPVENRRGQLVVREFTAPGPGRTIALAWRKGSALAASFAILAASMRDTLRPGRAPAAMLR